MGDEKRCKEIFEGHGLRGEDGGQGLRGEDGGWLRDSSSIVGLSVLAGAVKKLPIVRWTGIV